MDSPPCRTLWPTWLPTVCAWWKSTTKPRQWSRATITRQGPSGRGNRDSMTSECQRLVALLHTAAFECTPCFWVHSNLSLATLYRALWVGVTQCTLSGSIHWTRTCTCSVLYIVQNVLEQSTVQCSVYVKIELPCQDCTRTLFISITSSQSLWDFIFSLLFETYINFPSAYLLPFGSLTALETLIKWRSLLKVHLVKWHNKIMLFFVLTCAMCNVVAAPCMLYASPSSIYLHAQLVWPAAAQDICWEEIRHCAKVRTYLHKLVLTLFLPLPILKIIPQFAPFPKLLVFRVTCVYIRMGDLCIDIASVYTVLWFILFSTVECTLLQFTKSSFLVVELLYLLTVLWWYHIILS